MGWRFNSKVSCGESQGGTWVMDMLSLSLSHTHTQGQRQRDRHISRDAQWESGKSLARYVYGLAFLNLSVGTQESRELRKLQDREQRSWVERV